MRCFNAAGTPVACPAVDTLLPATATKIFHEARLPEDCATEFPAHNPFNNLTIDSIGVEITAYQYGKLVWRLSQPARSKLTAALFTPTGNILILWHITGNELGDVLWIVSAHGEILRCVEQDEIRAILTQPDGTIFYFLADDGWLVKLSASAEELWRCETDTTKYGSPPEVAVAPDGTIYVLFT